MMAKLCWVTGGGDQEKFTCLCPATASNISGACGAANIMHKDKVIWHYNYY